MGCFVRCHIIIISMHDKNIYLLNKMYLVEISKLEVVEVLNLSLNKPKISL